MPRYVGKIGILETGEAKAIIILFDVQEKPDKTVYTFSLVDYFHTQSRIILEDHGQGRIQLYYDDTYEDENQNELVVLPVYMEEQELVEFLNRMHNNEVPTILVDFGSDLYE